MTTDRIITGVILLFALAFLFLIVPQQVEEVDYSRIVPATVPKLALYIIAGAAAVQLYTGREKIRINQLVCLRAAIFVGVMTLGVWAMGRLGFEYVAPVMALAIMWLMGERRWLWLALGGFVLPLGTWLLVERVLDRALI